MKEITRSLPIKLKVLSSQGAASSALKVAVTENTSRWSRNQAIGQQADDGIEPWDGVGLAWLMSPRASKRICAPRKFYIKAQRAGK